MHVYDLISKTTILHLERKSVQGATFSPSGRYLTIFEKFVPSPTAPPNNVTVVDVESGETVMGFAQKTRSSALYAISLFFARSISNIYEAICNGRTAIQSAPAWSTTKSSFLI